MGHRFMVELKPEWIDGSEERGKATGDAEPKRLESTPLCHLPPGMATNPDSRTPHSRALVEKTDPASFFEVTSKSSMTRTPINLAICADDVPGCEDATGSLRTDIMTHIWISVGLLEMRRITLFFLQICPAQQEPRQYCANEIPKDGKRCVAPVGGSLSRDREQEMHETWSKITRRIDGISSCRAQRQTDAPDQAAYQDRAEARCDR
jgi:hypothetical protein